MSPKKEVISQECGGNLSDRDWLLVFEQGRPSIQLWLLWDEGIVTVAALCPGDGLKSPWQTEPHLARGHGAPFLVLAKS